MTIPPKLIAELRGLLAKATPGPWETEDWGYVIRPPRGDGKREPESVAHLYDGEYIENPECANDAALIVALRNNAPALLDALDTRHDADALREAAFLVALAEHGIDPSVGELLTLGDNRATVAPGALRKALRAALHLLKVEGQAT